MSTYQVALTGATGFIGQHLLHTLLADTVTQEAAVPASASSSATTDEPPYPPQFHPPRFQLRALIRNPQRQPAASVSPRLRWINGDLNTPAGLEQLVDGADIVIHNAGVVRGRSAQDFLSVNADGTERLARMARQAGVRRFILISSLAAREPRLSHYAASKAAAEARLQAITDLPWRIVRPPAVYGPGDKELAPLFNNMRKGLGAHPAGAHSRLSIIHVSDLARFIHLLAWYPTADKAASEWDQRIYEPDDGSGGYRWGDIRHAAEQAFSRRIRMLPIPKLALNLAAHTNLGLSRLFRYAPMLSPGKVRELTHHDWVCSPLPPGLPWRAEIDLVAGLKGGD